MKSEALHIISLFCATLMLSGCVKDFSEPGFVGGSGQADVDMTVSFHPSVTSSIVSRTAGDAISDIDDLAIVIYNADGSLFRTLSTADGTLSGVSYSDVEYSSDNKTDLPPAMSSDDNRKGGTWDDETNRRATFRMKDLPVGRYRIYCVANMGDKIHDIVQSEQTLKNHSLEWNAGDIAANDAMFGYFTVEGDKYTDQPMENFEAPTLDIDRENIALHAWIKRAVSKITVAFDPSGLHQDVFIYIHSVTVKDAPAECLLGGDNTPTDASQLISGDKLFYNANGENVDAGEDYQSWLLLTNGSGKKGAVNHTPTDNALFFFENMQGDYEFDLDRERYNKVPQRESVYDCLVGDYQHPEKYDTKDNVPYGTYIEVDGYYVSRNIGNIGRGPIKYRFMLGKNTTYDFNAQRNHHYKLTLNFNGWANQPEWHIDYVEDKPGLYAPDVFYMPYLYNEKALLPIKVIGNVQSVKVEIVENDWAPCSIDGVNPPGNESGTGFKWNATAHATYNGTSAPYLGFLQLTKPDHYPVDILSNYSHSDGTTGLTALKNYYEGRAGSGNTIPQNVRTLTDFTPDVVHDDLGQLNSYTVTAVSTMKTIELPLFTRAKSMLSTSGYTGNNPYKYHYRKAKLRISATFLKNGETVEYPPVEVRVMQVPRVINPKAVWRKTGSPSSFDVTLMRCSGPNLEDDFVPYTSTGSWSAYIETSDNPDNFSLELTSSESSFDEDGTTIIGKTGSEMSFKVNFGGEEGCAIVTVKYNGNTCIHKILLRQGYDKPMAVVDGGAEWASFNLYKASGTFGSSGTVSGTFAKSPLSIGSYFKRGNYNEAIKESNNNRFPHLVTINPNSNEPLLDLASGGGKKWYLIYGVTNSSANYGWEWATFNVDGDLYSVPSYDDYQAITDYADKAFGVLYGDGATTTQRTTDKAYGFDDTTGELDDVEYGVRGIVVYNSTNAHQIFFPIGKSGYGRRSQFNCTNIQRGRLLYGDVASPLSVSANYNNIYRPIPFDLPTSPGALYWLNKRTINPNNANENHAAWDMNFFSLDFSAYTSNCLGYSVSTDSDAIPIKLVRKR